MPSEIPSYTPVTTNTFDGIGIGASTPPANVNIGLLTEGYVDGNGAFDIMMKTAKAHLDVEYASNRITGKEYTTAFVALYAATIQAAGSFLVQHREAERVAAETGLLRQKTNTELANTQSTVSTTLAFNTSSTVGGLVKGQLDNQAKQREVQDKQMAVQDSQIEVQNKQQDLYDAQINGFDRDAEQKLAKILVDSWSVRRTTDEATIVPGGLDDSSIGAVIAKAKIGIGA